jgi:probable rRNA maturation factor
MTGTTAILVKRVRAGGSPDSRTIARRAARILEQLDVEGAELSVVLCDDAFIRELNREYRGIDRPTDVLSFPQDEADQPAAGARMLGDVVISLDTAARQAKERRSGTADEVTALLVHGVLHLLGWDHETPADAQAMAGRAEAIERAISRRICRRG